MTAHVSCSEPGARSSNRTRAIEDTEAGRPEQSIENLPPSSPTHPPEPDDPACESRAGHAVTDANEEIPRAEFIYETDSSYTVWLRRDKAVSYLRSVGYSLSARRLAKQAVTRDGPESCCFDPETSVATEGINPRTRHRAFERPDSTHFGPLARPTIAPKESGWHRLSAEPRRLMLVVTE